MPLTVSVVSHGHGRMVAHLLGDLERFAEITHVVLTHNIPEEPVQIPSGLASRLVVTTNRCPEGFAANHNAAFRRFDTRLFCVMNPDIRLPENPFPSLIRRVLTPGVGLAAPAVVNPGGSVECTARRFPSPAGIVLKLAGIDDGAVPYRIGGIPVRPDWVAGMFHLVRSDAFAGVGGFDEGYHLYYEDVDLCVRLRKAHYEVLFCPEVTIVHDAQRASHTNPRFMAWHLQSMMRYFARHLGRLPSRSLQS